MTVLSYLPTPAVSPPRAGFIPRWPTLELSIRRQPFAVSSAIAEGAFLAPRYP